MCEREPIRDRSPHFHLSSFCPRLLKKSAPSGIGARRCNKKAQSDGSREHSYSLSVARADLTCRHTARISWWSVTEGPNRVFDPSEGRVKLIFSLIFLTAVGVRFLVL